MRRRTIEMSPIGIGRRKLSKGIQAPDRRGCWTHAFVSSQVPNVVDEGSTIRARDAADFKQKIFYNMMALRRPG